ncbi:MAG: efflux RND transporter periplasmic adaptor subunit [Piscinibacter sp.]
MHALLPSRRGLTVALALAAATVLAACGESRSAAPAASARPTTVGVLALQAESVPLSTELPGRTSAPLVAEIRPQVGGIVQARRFTEGTLVKAGQVLYQIDSASYQAAQASALAAVAKAEAVVETSQLTAQRRAELAKIDAVSQQDVQDAQATLKQAQADLASARATLATARLNLDRTLITSPIAGRVDVSSVTPGALVTADQTSVLTTVRQVDPIQVDVTQSSADLLRLKRDLADGRLQRAGADAQVTLLLEDGSTYAHSGRLSIAGVSVNTATGAVTLRAVFPNPEGLLLPGMYVRAQLPTAVASQGLLVPQQAVSRNASGAASVLVVDAQDTVQRRAITADRAVGNRWLVSAGLAAGERVVVEGAQKVKAGDVVQAQPVTLSAPAAAASAASAAAAASAPARVAAR